MKKLVVVLLLTLAFVSVAAAEVTFSGELDYGFAVNADAFAGKFDKIELDIKATAGDFNTVSIEIEDKNKTNDIGDVPLMINWADVTTDWAGALGLPIGVKTSIGYNGYGFGDAHAVTGWSFEDFNGGIWLAKEGAMKLSVTPADMVTILAMVDFASLATDDLAMMFAADVNVGPVSAVAGYDTTGDGQFYVEGSFITDVAEGMTLSVGASLLYTDVAAYGAGVAFSAMGATAGVSMTGDDTDALADLGIDLGYDVTDALNVYVAPLMNLRDGADVFAGVDFGATYTVGGVGYTLGYATADTCNYAGITSVADGGLYMNVKVNF